MLIVEDGTGLSSANASISLAEFKAYCDPRGKDYSAFSDELINQAIVRTGTFLSSLNWRGYRSFQRQQTMPFPRFGLFDKEGWPILENEIPQEYKDASAEIAFAEVVTPFTMTPSVTQSDKVLHEQVGPISTTYANLFTAASDARPVIVLVRDLLAPFLEAPRGAHLLR